MSSSSFILKAGAVLSALSSTTLAHYAPPAYGYKSSSTPVAYGHSYPSSKPAGYEHGHKTSTPCTTSTPAAYGYPSSSSPTAYAYSSPAADYASEYAPEYSSATDDYASEYAPEYTPSSSADYASEYSPEYTTTEKKYPTKTPVNYGTTSTPCSTETPVYVSYDTTSTPCSTETPVYYDASSVPSYEVKSSYVPYEHYEHSAPSYNPKPSTPVAYEPYTTSKPKIYSHIITATYTRTYVDICSTGYTTKTTTQTVEYCPETTHTYATAPPPGLTITTKVCTACAATPVTVTLTLPCETTSTYVASETPLSYTYCKTCTNLTPTYTHEHVHKTYPVAPTPYVDDSTSTIYQSKISTVYVAPSPAPPSYETSPAPPSYETSSAPPSYETSLVPPPCVGEGCTATLPVPPKPYPTPATNVYQNDYMTLSYGTGTASAYVPSKTYASDMPYFTGGAGAVRVGGAVVGGVVAAVAMVL